VTSPNPERRSERARQAILRAALELCTEQGFVKMTMEGVAKRAGVGKQTIYRWWPSKAAVLEEAVNDAAADSADFPDTGDIAVDLRTQMTAVAQAFVSPMFMPYAGGLIAAAQSDESIARSVADTIIGPRVAACRKRLAVAQEQGQIRPDVDLDDVVEMLYAPLYYRLLLHTRPVSVEQVSSILELTFNGVLPPDRR
jgi:AcrR family transcriptional regulator